VDAYGHAIAMEPTRAEAYVGQGRALLDLGDPGGAAAVFQRALGQNPRYSVAEFWLGEAYRRSGQKSQAIEAYGRYLKAAPEGAEAARAQEALKGLGN
jgi:tetratricopeptide (TPR) repeat protein